MVAPLVTPEHKDKRNSSLCLEKICHLKCNTKIKSTGVALNYLVPRMVLEVFAHVVGLREKDVDSEEHKTSEVYHGSSRQGCDCREVS